MLSRRRALTQCTLWALSSISLCESTLSPACLPFAGGHVAHPRYLLLFWFLRNAKIWSFSGTVCSLFLLLRNLFPGSSSDDFSYTSDPKWKYHREGLQLLVCEILQFQPHFPIYFSLWHLESIIPFFMVPLEEDLSLPTVRPSDESRALVCLAQQSVWRSHNNA